MNNEFLALLEEIEKSKGITKESLIEAIEQAVLSAYKKHYSATHEAIVKIDTDTGTMKLYKRLEIVENVEDAKSQISLEEAKQISSSYQIGDMVDIETMPETFGRIAAQTARQIVVQKLREGERNMIFNRFNDKVGEIVTGVVKCYDKRNVIFDVNDSEVTLGLTDQVPSEKYSPGNRCKLIITGVNKTPKGTHVFVSRSHADLVKRMFELEIPEISNGTIEIMQIAREPGARTKISVKSNDTNVDPIGACIGAKGARVQSIVDELKGEKMDIIKYSDDIVTYVSSALSPAKVTHGYTEEEEKICNIIVPDNQLSLAIGKEGQNARLAAKLTGWKIDIKSESRVAEE